MKLKVPVLSDIIKTLSLNTSFCVSEDLSLKIGLPYLIFTLLLPSLLLIKVNQYSALIVLVLILVTMMTTLWPIERGHS